MPTVYCDHNILIDVLARGFPSPFNELLNDRRVDLVFSTTHLIEAAKMRTLQGATEMAQLFECSGRYWLIDRISLELDEIRHVLNEGPPPQPFRRTVTEMWAKLTNQEVRPEKVTAMQVIQTWQRLGNPMLTAHLQNAASFRANVRDIEKKRKLARMSDAELARSVVRFIAAEHRLPIDRSRLARFDVASMPTTHVEIALSRLRWTHGGNLSWQTFMDVQHLVTAMPHVDIYITRDRRKRNKALALKERCTSSKAEVVESLDDAVTALRI